MVLVVFLFLGLLPSDGLAGDGSNIYWVDTDGAQTDWDLCESATPLEGVSACRLAVANANAVAGDVIYLRSGTYENYNRAIDPSNSGTSHDNRIIYSNYNGEDVVISEAAYGIHIYKKSYITVQGIKIRSSRRWLRIYGGHYNIINHCDFDLRSSSSGDWAGAIIADDPQDSSENSENSTHNWVHHCSFSRFIYGSYDEHRGGLLDVGSNSASGENRDESYFNVIEDNVFFYGGHHNLGIYSNYNVIRNNYFHNESWDWEGYRDFITEGPVAGKCLYEGNRFAYAFEASGMALRSFQNIIRFNAFYNNGSGGVQIVSTSSTAKADENHIFNNVFYHNGHQVAYSGFQGGIFLCGWGVDDPRANVIKNNIFFDNKNGSVSRDAVTNPQMIENNWDHERDGDPNFVNLNLGEDGKPKFEYHNSNLPNFYLNPTSGAIDKGIWLTEAVGSANNSNTLVVTDALYFQDGSWGPGYAGVQADFISVGKTSDSVRISSVNYGTNTLTLSRPMTWSNGDKIWLFKDSRGNNTLVGSAPDLGAFEYEAGIPEAPTNVRIK